jgi:toxin ParE2
VTVRFLEVAREELDEAIKYYNDHAPGLGDAFLVETLAAIDRIERFPQAWHRLGENTRRCRLRRFPYSLVYNDEPGKILVLAVAHLHRHPDYWKDRVKRS